MGTVAVMWRRWNERRKLRRGQCLNCGTPLRDDAADCYCSDRCAREHQDKLAW